MEMPMSQFSRSRIAALAAAVLVLGACESGPDVRADYDKAADFSQYKTFNFLTDANTAKSLALQNLQRAAQREMEQRGYTMTAQNPDLLVHFQGKIEEKTEIESTPAPYYGGYGYRGWYGAPYGGWGGTEVSTRRYNVGTVVMDVVDRAKQQVVFQAGLSDVVTKEMRQNMSATIDAAVTQMFARYPFVAGSGTPKVLPEQK
jgi:hypothetical protein